MTNKPTGRSQWPRCLRRRSATARLLRLWDRIPQGAWMSVCCECCVLSGRLSDELFTRPEKSYRLRCVVVCDLKNSWMRTAWSTGGLSHRKQTNKPTTLRTSSVGRAVSTFLYINITLCLFIVRTDSDMKREWNYVECRPESATRGLRFGPRKWQYACRWVMNWHQFHYETTFTCLQSAKWYRRQL